MTPKAPATRPQLKAARAAYIALTQEEATLAARLDAISSEIQAATAANDTTKRRELRDERMDIQERLEIMPGLKAEAADQLVTTFVAHMANEADQRRSKLPEAIATVQNKEQALKQAQTELAAAVKAQHDLGWEQGIFDDLRQRAERGTMSLDEVLGRAE
jgi:hypothetical protein